MAASPRRRGWLAVLLATAGLAASGGTASGQILPWEVTVAEIETGRLRSLAERLAKQNLLYQFRLGEVRKADLVETADQIDRILKSLEKGSPSYSIPAPWNEALREDVARVDATWGPLRAIATASPYDYIRMSRQFMPAENRGTDPLRVRYFDALSLDLLTESEKLLDHYHDECMKTRLDVCSTAKTSGYAPMLIERATKAAIYVVVGLEVDRNRKKLNDTLAAYREVQQANDADPFFAAALDPERSPSAKAARELFLSQRSDWNSMRQQFAILADGDEKNFDLDGLLRVQRRLVAKIERLGAALMRYASLTYGT